MKQIFLIIVAVIAIIIIILFLNPNPHFRVTKTVNTQADGNQVLNLTLTANKHFKPIEPESVNLQVTHKYNKSINETYELTAYEPGKYSFFYDPTEPGEYTFTFIITMDNKEHVKTIQMTFDSV